MQTVDRLTRSRSDRMIAGVAGGVSRYLDIDPALARLIFVLLAFTGIGVLAYPVLWLVMPLESAAHAQAARWAKVPVQEQSARVDDEARERYMSAMGATDSQPGAPAVARAAMPATPRFDPLTGQPLSADALSVSTVAAEAPPRQTTANNGRLRLLGYLLLAIGGFLLMNLLIPGAEQFIFPAVLIVVGVLLLRRKSR